jgi:dienelactone hydrolase
MPSDLVMARSFLAFLTMALLVSAAEGRDERPDPRVRPGATFVIKFPQLGPTWHKQPTTQMQVYIPTDYTPDRDFPLLTWFGGGYGSHKASLPKGITAGKGYICAGLPYRGKDADRGKNGLGYAWSTKWAYFEPMIQALETAVPNIHPKKRIAGGFSSGGSAIGFHIDNSPGFRKYYSAYMPANYVGWANRPAGYEGKPVLGFGGENDPRYGAQKVARLIETLKRVGSDMEYILFKGHGHTVAREYFPQMKEWMDRKVKYSGLAEAVKRLDDALAAKQWLRANRAVADVLGNADPSRPEWEHAIRALQPISVAAEEAYTKLKSRRTTADAWMKFVADWSPCSVVEQARRDCDALGQKELATLLKRVSRRQAATLKAFVTKWKGYPVQAQAKEACNALGEKDLDALLKRKPLSSRRLKDFLETWTGFPVHARALDTYDGLAQKAFSAVEKMRAGSSRTRALGRFIDQWRPTPTSQKAAAMLDTEAAKILAEIEAAPEDRQRELRLMVFVRSYADTASGKRAKSMLEAMRGR